MMTHMMKVQEEERRRFSRELHDGIGQSIFSLLIQLDRLISETRMTELEQLRNHVAAVIEDVRGLAWELRPSVLDDLGVVPALRTYIDNYSNHYGIRVHFRSNLRQRLDANKETTIYRIVQEALTNTAKYADVAEARVELLEHDTYVEAHVEDDGKGFVRDTLSQASGCSVWKKGPAASAAHSRSVPGPGMERRFHSSYRNERPTSQRPSSKP